MLIRELNALREAQQIGDPILALSPLVWLDREGIDSSATSAGDNVDTWTCKVSSTVFNKVGSTQPVLETGSNGRAVMFSGSSAVSITDATCTTLGINFRPTVDVWSFVVMLGDDSGASGTLIGKQQNAASNTQYQFAVQNQANGIMATTFGRLTGQPSTFTQFDVASSGVIDPNTVYMAIAGNTDIADVRCYEDTTEITDITSASANLLYDNTNSHPLFIGARRNSSDTSVGFQFEGSIAHVLIFDYELTSDNRTTIVNNLT